MTFLKTVLAQEMYFFSFSLFVTEKKSRLIPSKGIQLNKSKNHSGCLNPVSL